MYKCINVYVHVHVYVCIDMTPNAYLDSFYLDQPFSNRTGLPHMHTYTCTISTCIYVYIYGTPQKNTTFLRSQGFWDKLPCSV